MENLKARKGVLDSNYDKYGDKNRNFHFATRPWASYVMYVMRNSVRSCIVYSL